MAWHFGLGLLHVRTRHLSECGHDFLYWHFSQLKGPFSASMLYDRYLAKTEDRGVKCHKSPCSVSVSLSLQSNPDSDTFRHWWSDYWVYWVDSSPLTTIIALFSVSCGGQILPPPFSVKKKPSKTYLLSTYTCNNRQRQWTLPENQQLSGSEHSVKAEAPQDSNLCPV